ncbi:MAG: metallophosphoesterase [Clostridiales bacterium]|nr:metallophosphoesterase [Clostridiales bacterium]
MKVYAISDLHLSINNPKPMNIFGEVWDNYLEDIEESLACVNADDLVLLAGDLSWAMKLDSAVPDLEYIGKFPGIKIITRGNHDYWWNGISLVRAKLPQNVYAIQNDCVKLGDVIVCGSRGWSIDDKTEEGKKLYARELIRIEMSLQSMEKLRTEKDRVVFMLHYPPFNVRFEDSPVTDLFKKYAVDAVVYGHLHGKDCRSKPFVEKNGIGYYLTSCDQIKNKAVEIVLPEKSAI